ncbi:MAG: hypothetical protein HY303_08200 [Candidatus Wallbacteria bacterium]|nr:hypothetical protein [Candidatus Wallbacteria bacterium]
MSRRTIAIGGGKDRMASARATSSAKSPGFGEPPGLAVLPSRAGFGAGGLAVGVGVAGAGAGVTAGVGGGEAVVGSLRVDGPAVEVVVTGGVPEPEVAREMSFALGVVAATGDVLEVAANAGAVNVKQSAATVAQRASGPPPSWILVERVMVGIGSCDRIEPQSPDKHKTVRLNYSSGMRDRLALGAIMA